VPDNIEEVAARYVATAGRYGIEFRLIACD
jgi:hypothetical protein